MKKLDKLVNNLADKIVKRQKKETWIRKEIDKWKRKLKRGQEKREIKEEAREDLEGLIFTIGSELQDATERKAQYAPGSKEYDAVVKEIEALTKSYTSLQAQYDKEFVNVKKDFDWGSLVKLVSTVIVVLATLMQSFVLINAQQDGVMIGRDTMRMQMPRVGNV